MIEFHFAEDSGKFLISQEAIKAVVQIASDDNEFPNAVSLITEDGEFVIAEKYEDVRAKLAVDS